MSKKSQSIDAKLEALKKGVVEREKNAVVQLPLWPEPKRGAPNSFIRSALFAAIQSKDRQFLKETVLRQPRRNRRQVHRRAAQSKRS